MAEAGALSRREIHQQPSTWETVLQTTRELRDSADDFLSRVDPDTVIFTGAGSSYYLARASARVFQKLTGVTSRAYPASELFLFEDSILPVGDAESVLLVPFSRSGETTETVRATKHLRQRYDIRSFGLSCYPDSDLAGAVDRCMALPAAQEESVVMTQSFTSMLLAVQRVASHWSNEDEVYRQLEQLPPGAETVLEQAPPLVESILDGELPEHFVFLGGGPLYGLALESELKMTEMALAVSEGYHPLEYRHGPKSRVTDRTLVLMMGSDSGFDQEMKLAREMADLGAGVAYEGPDHGGSLPGEIDHALALQTDLDEYLRGPLHMPLCQLLALHVALAKGLNPDRPKNLTQVVTLDEE